MADAAPAGPMTDGRSVASCMLRSGARWRDCPPECGPYTTTYNRFNRWSQQGIWFAMFKALTGSAAVFGTALIDSSHVKAHRSAGGGKGAFAEAIGRSRGGRTTTIHAVTDALGRPRVLRLVPGNVHDVMMAAEIVVRHRLNQAADRRQSLRYEPVSAICWRSLKLSPLSPRSSGANR